MCLAVCFLARMKRAYSEYSMARVAGSDRSAVKQSNLAYGMPTWLVMYATL